jgi:methionyl-tRNA formyltransferase
VPSHHRDPAPVETFAKEAGLPLHFASSRGALDKIIQEKRFSSRLGVIVDYGVIVSQAVIDVFQLGIVNSHFSLLPEWRGADPITFAILSGQQKTGVSLMLIEPTLDTGKILVQKSMAIDESDTTLTLTTKLVQLSNTLLETYLPKYWSGTLRPRSQPHPSRATYSRKLTKNDGLIDWSKPATQLAREVRAFVGWPRSRATIGGKELILTRVQPAKHNDSPGEPGNYRVDAKTHSLEVATTDGWLVIESVQPVGKNEMSIAAFLAGNKL